MMDFAAMAKDMTERIARGEIPKEPEGPPLKTNIKRHTPDGPLCYSGYTLEYDKWSHKASVAAGVISDEAYFTKAKRCPMCHREKFLKENLGKEITWDDLAVPTVSYGQGVNIVRDWSPDTDNWCMLLYQPGNMNDESGNFGTGKTTCLCLKACDVIDEGKDVRYYNVADILADTRRSYSGGEDPQDELDEFEGLIILDDLGAESSSSSWAKEQVDRLIDRRFRKRRPTLIASNLTMEELKERYPRAVSRLSSGCLMPWDGLDFRVN